MKYYLSISKKVNLFVYRFIRVVIGLTFEFNILIKQIVFIVALLLQRFDYRRKKCATIYLLLQNKLIQKILF